MMQPSACSYDVRELDVTDECVRTEFVDVVGPGHCAIACEEREETLQNLDIVADLHSIVHPCCLYVP
jgi:hypothetical protein